ncbi:MAG: orotate phosphoribosyltransferase [Deltaproteobacteria bacterium]|nr:orotate phosphoribosyltransferase [Deltaproteobacteria bacterium]
MKSPKSLRPKLLSLLKEKSYLKKKVILSSGKESDFYIDVKQTALHPEGMTLIGQLLFEKLKTGEKVKAIGGLTMGADPLCVATSLVSMLKKSPMASFYIRKEPKKHGTEQGVEGTANLAKGMKVAIVEDVVTTGASTLQAIERAQAAGYVVKRVLAIVDREEGGRETLQKAGFTLESLFTKSDFI